MGASLAVAGAALEARNADSDGVRTAAGAAKKGQIVEISLSGRQLGRLRGMQRGDEFGSEIGADAVPGFGGGGCLIGAPGASSSAGRVVVRDCSDPSRIAGPLLYSIGGASLAGGPVERFGETLIDLGHVNGESAVHWAVGAPGRGLAGGPESAVVILHGVGDSLGERLRLTSGAAARLGWRLSPLEHGGIGNFFTSFAATAPGQARGAKRDAGAVYRIDTVSGEVLWATRGSRRGQFLGYSLAGVPDVNEDGVPDLLAGAPGRPNRKPAGAVWLLSGADGRVLRRFAAPRGARLFGFSVARGDIDGDGESEIIVGAPRTPTAAGEDAGSVFVLNFAGRTVLRWDGETPGQWLGVDVAAVARGSDLSRRDLAASSLFADAEQPRRDRRGGLEIFSAESRTVIGRKLGRRGGDRLGWRILSCFDSCRVQAPRTPDFFAPE